MTKYDEIACNINNGKVSSGEISELASLLYVGLESIGHDPGALTPVMGILGASGSEGADNKSLETEIHKALGLE